MPNLSDKEKREDAIFRLIENNTIGTQTDLVDALLKEGFDVTQATVSRDVRSLGLVKRSLPGGGFRYSAPGQTGLTARRFSLSSFITGFSQAEAFCVVNTLPGRGMLVAVTIDELNIPEVAGTLAGDDIVLILIKKEKDKEKVEEALSQFF